MHGILYRLVDKDSQDILLMAEDLRGFFIGADEEPRQTVVFAGTRYVKKVKRVTESAVLEVVGRQMESIGSYYIGRITREALESPNIQEGGEGYPDVKYSFHGSACEYPWAGEIWRMWSANRPDAPGEWVQYPSEYHASWLHVVQTAWFSSGLRATRYQTAEMVRLDGAVAVTRDAFYCAIGEAVNGPGGYFGSNLDALYDCLRTMKRDGGSPFRLEWSDSLVSRGALGGEFTGSVISMFEEFGVCVDLADD
ncbi:barstar family protein [Streptomyces albus]|uniref:barstar family protein n=1 Tax=Streptomyces albus TaxID=1888 RepID=UPI001FC9753D|nr:barstar family protein [Streptomyces albus]